MSTATAPALQQTQEKSSINELALEDQIRALAHELWQQRSDTSGSDVSDWLKAEEEILAREEYRKSWEDLDDQFAE